MAKRRVYPLPVEEMLAHPSYLRMTNGARGAAWSLIGWWWMAECPDLPTNPSELYCLCRPNPRTWALYREEILRLVREVTPAMRAYHNYRCKRNEINTELGQRGASILRLKAITRKRMRDDGPAAPVRDAAGTTERPARPEERGARGRFGP